MSLFRFTRIYLAVPVGTNNALNDSKIKDVPKLSSLFQPLSTSRRSDGIDHVIMDIQPFAGHGSSFIKDLIGPEKDYEVSRYVYHNAVRSVYKRLKPRKTFAMILDGTDPLFKLRRIRRVKNKKAENRFLRCAGAPMSFAIEDRLKFFMSDQVKNAASAAAAEGLVDEVLLSGPATPGPFESKMSAWMLDLGTRATASKNSTASENSAETSSSAGPTPIASSGTGNTNGRDQLQRGANSSSSNTLTPLNQITRKDTVAIIGGGSELHLVALAATPFHNIQIMISEKGELKTCELSDIIDWHTPVTSSKSCEAGRNILQEWYQNGDNQEYTRARIDLALLHIIGDGFEAVDLMSVAGVNLRELLEKYFTHNLPKKAFLTREDPETGEVLVDAATLETLIATVGNVKLDGRAAPNVLAQDHINIMMQGLSCLVDGGIKNYSLIPDAKYDVSNKAAALVTPQQLVHHLRYLHNNKKGLLRASKNPSFAVTPAEMMFLAAQHSDWITNHAPFYTGGFMLPEKLATSVIETENITDALSKTQSILKKAKEQKLHRGLEFSPSHLWKKSVGSAGPPQNYKYYSVNLGIAACEGKTRQKIAEEESIGFAVTKKVKNPLIVFEKTTRSWMEYPHDDEALLSTVRQNPEHKSLEAAGIQQLKVVDWNVQFNRYSGKTTPLGKEGIDWCSPTRYVALSRILSRTDADIIGMQEVEAPFWNYLSQQEWVKENYMFSTNSGKGSAIDPWGNLMMIHRRVPVTKMGSVNVQGHPGHVSLMPSCNIRVNNKGTELCVNVCHLLAPYTQGNVDQRKNQINRLIERLSTKYVGNDVLIMGDFNDYPADFFRNFPSAMGNYRDSWVEVHGSDDGDAGWTINGLKNTYTSLIIEPEFYGRADRLYVKSEHLVAKEAELVGTKSVREENGIQSIKEYLFPSDHFGVMVKYDVKY